MSSDNSRTASTDIEDSICSGYFPLNFGRKMVHSQENRTPEANTSGMMISPTPHAERPTEATSLVPEAGSHTSKENLEKEMPSIVPEAGSHTSRENLEKEVPSLVPEAGFPTPEENPDLLNLDEIKPEEKDFLFDPLVARRELDFLMGCRRASPLKRRVKKKFVADPPGSTLSNANSLQILRSRVSVSKGVELVLPSSSGRANAPPPNHFTLYESFFDMSYLWFPIPELVLQYLHVYGLTLAPLTPRGLRHLIGILIRSYECDLDIGVGHLQNLLEVRNRKGSLTYYISNKKDRKIIKNFPSKDADWETRFFYVLVNPASVGERGIDLVKTSWAPIGS